MKLDPNRRVDLVPDQEARPLVSVETLRQFAATNPAQYQHMSTNALYDAYLAQQRK